MTRRNLLAMLSALGFGARAVQAQAQGPTPAPRADALRLTDAEWKKRLSPEAVRGAAPGRHRARPAPAR